jgi:hypothetical protein
MTSDYYMEQVQWNYTEEFLEEHQEQVIDRQRDLLNCPVCKAKKFDGNDCDECGFDAHCYDPSWG